MEMTISAIWLPIIATVIFLGLMLRPYHEAGWYDFGVLFRVLWLLPISITWTVYFAFT